MFGGNQMSNKIDQDENIVDDELNYQVKKDDEQYKICASMINLQPYNLLPFNMSDFQITAWYDNEMTCYKLDLKAFLKFCNFVRIDCRCIIP